MKRIYQVVSLLSAFMFLMTACNLPAFAPTAGPAPAFVLVTSDPNASQTPTAFQPFVPTAGPTGTPSIVSPTPSATADPRWWSEGRDRVNYHNPANGQEFMVERLPIASCANPTVISLGLDEPMDIDGTMTFSRRGGDGVWSFYLILDNVSANLWPPVWSTECMRLTLNGIVHEFVSEIPFGVTPEP